MGSFGQVKKTVRNCKISNDDSKKPYGRTIEKFNSVINMTDKFW